MMLRGKVENALISYCYGYYSELENNQEFETATSFERPSSSNVTQVQMQAFGVR